jgi:hypothetical protein
MTPTSTFWRSVRNAGPLTTSAIASAEPPHRPARVEPLPSPKGFCAHMGSKDAIDLISRFETKYCPEPNTGCWLWFAHHDQDGYGTFYVNSPKPHSVRAHRFAWELWNGAIPDGNQVRHSCSTNCCVNPQHLYLELENAGRKPVAAGQRFWSKVDKRGPDECWEWKAKCNPNGYGQFRVKEHTTAHRVSWELTNGPIPEGLYVCHRCDNPPCVNPAHLFLGTAQDNARDMVKKGRDRASVCPESIVRGEKVGSAKLTNEQVIRIRSDYAGGGISCRELAAKYGVNRGTIRAVLTRKQWAHL